MRTLAIETSCDDTSLAIVRDGQWIESLVVGSQINAHQKYGGVVPELAARMHTEAIHRLLPKCLRDADVALTDIDHIAVTTTPGLEGALLIGVAVAKTLAIGLDIPITPVNHIKGHICSIFLDNATPVAFPIVALVVSGGHTQLWEIQSLSDMTILGETRDDAAGEAFDKVGRLLGLGYPGGPIIEKRAQEGNPDHYRFPEPMRHSDYEFSFSGLKTAVGQWVASQSELDDITINHICASFQKTVITALLRKASHAVTRCQAKTLAIVGGVAANRTLVNTAIEQFPRITVIAPAIRYCTDNAAMIAAAAHFCGHPVPVTEVRVGLNQ